MRPDHRYVHLDQSKHTKVVPMNGDVGRLVLDARSLLARLLDDLQRRPDLGWVEAEVNDAQVALTEAQGLIPDAPSQDVLERAWRNGWGSALNFLRAAENMAAAQPLPGAEDPKERAIVLELVSRWVQVIDGVTEEAVSKGREIGFAAVPARATGTQNEEGTPDDA